MVIVTARYGVSQYNGPMKSGERAEINVTDTVQAMVVSRGSSGGYVIFDDDCPKTSYPGFYDPCPNVKGAKHLEIEYIFGNKFHRCRAADREYLDLPRQEHLPSYREQAFSSAGSTAWSSPMKPFATPHKEISDESSIVFTPSSSPPGDDELSSKPAGAAQGTSALILGGAVALSLMVWMRSRGNSWFGGQMAG